MDAPLAAPIAGLYWDDEDEEVVFIWSVGKDASAGTWALHYAHFAWLPSGYTSMVLGAWRDLPAAELKRFHVLPVTQSLIQASPFCTDTRAVFEELAQIPDLDLYKASDHLTRRNRTKPLQWLQVWWRKTVTDLMAAWWIPQWLARRLANVEMLHLFPLLDEYLGALVAAAEQERVQQDDEP